MPNRMLRDWTNSDRINSISIHAERFFTRLIMKVDDYGCFYADSRLLKANLYPLLLDAIRDADLLRWLAECQKAGLIVVYENSGKRYLQISDFRQRLDKARHKFPLPIDTDIPESVNEFPAEGKEKTEVENEVEGKAPPLEVNAEEIVFKNPIELERICMATKKTPGAAAESLHKYHLHLMENNKYPMSKRQIFAGFEKWLMNEKNFTNGAHQQHTGSGNKRNSKSAGAKQYLDELRPAEGN